MNHWPRVEVRINIREVLFDRIETALEYGWNRAHKHTDKPTPEQIKGAQYEAITNAIYDLLSWGDDEADT